jgi:NAD(P)-dependent dehydrogenase (short-subunit alcohol dehydrogenase family)
MEAVMAGSIDPRVAAPSVLSLSLAGKVALVKGGSDGAGPAIVRRLARQGADVALTHSGSPGRARFIAAEIGAYGRRSLAIEADGAKPDDLAVAIGRTVAEFGRLDFVVDAAESDAEAEPDLPSMIAALAAAGRIPSDCCRTV